MIRFPQLHVTQGAYIDMDLTLLQDGVALDLTDAASLLCQVRQRRDNSLIATLTPVITNTATGLVNLTGGSADWPITTSTSALIADLRMLYNGEPMYFGPWEFVVGIAVSVP